VYQWVFCIKAQKIEGQKSSRKKQPQKAAAKSSRKKQPQKAAKKESR
jgi:hypothetical protein